MAYVITDSCLKDELCVDACPVDCIHPKKDEEGFEAAKQLYVNPDDCIDCGASFPLVLQIRSALRTNCRMSTSSSLKPIALITRLSLQAITANFA